MRLPKLVYEVCPWFYVLGGAAAITLSDKTLALASGLVLIISGVVILFLRRNYRSTQQLLGNL